jgi:hypothetical protein
MGRYSCNESRLFWANRELGCNLRTVSAKDWIRDIGSRAVLINQAKEDEVVSSNGGQI